ncbi:peptidase S8 [Romeria aff. gracilis LEGE 07310]|uniref:Peptidase S8 n=1 Tax=Vasconcelosia minhoensis LEGE 07310 TaxID=915328 RepID=A0A8J7DKD0_9CYAN|nr:S8 family serine peptidase [Romeria gracilis]MBE9076236.1 peptidase S8 [Romeria aff. gracilis LEGE 07310]
MKRLFLIFFLIGLFAVAAAHEGFQTGYSSNLANSDQAEFESIILDFREAPGLTRQIDDRLANLAQQFNLSPALNSEFSEADHVYVVQGDRDILQALRNSDLARFTEFIEPNYIYQSLFVPDDPDYAKQWNLQSINVEGAWAQNRGSGATVAVIDTGISRTPDLQKTNFVPGYDFVNDRDQADDDNGHGTHVAGTIAQSTNNGYGVAGIAYEANLMPLKVLSAQGFGNVADITEAIRFAADNGADVINMSLGGGGASELMQEAVEYAHSKGVVIVAAAGNESSQSASYPAKYRHVIGVSAFDADGKKAPYSNYGLGVDIAAPGGSTLAGESGGILQETIDRLSGKAQFKYFQGTSMAAPHVAGVAAVLKSIGIEAPETVETVLEYSAQKVGRDSSNAFGAGKLDAAAAAQMATVRLPWWGQLWQFLRSLFWFDAKSIPWKDLLLRGAIAAAFTWLFTRMARFPWQGNAYLIGIFLGAIGLFIFKGLHVMYLPDWPLRLVGSAIPELGSALWRDPRLNPVFASCLIPLAGMLLLLSHRTLRWFSMGLAVGVAAFLSVSLLESTYVLWIGANAIAQAFIGVNVVLCLAIAAITLRVATSDGL